MRRDPLRIRSSQDKQAGRVNVGRRGRTRRTEVAAQDSESVDAFKFTKTAPGTFVLDYGDRGRFTLVVAEA